MNPEWFKVLNKGDDAGEIYIYGLIVEEKWMDEDVTPSWFKDQVAKLKKLKAINLFVNSPGGGVFAGLTIYNIINRLEATVTAYIDGLAASIASVVVMAADKIIMPKNALMMIHNPWGCACGSAADMRKEAEILDRAKLSILSTYAGKTKKPESELSRMMDEETWMTGTEAKNLGFSDILEEKQEIKACLDGQKFIVNGVEVDIEKFKSFPKARFSVVPADAGKPRLINANHKFLTLKKGVLV